MKIKMNVTLISIGLISISSAFISCNKSSHNDAPQPNYSYVPDTAKFAIPYAYYNINGYTQFYYPNSYVLSCEGNYQNGTPSGYWKQYYANGRMMKEGNYSNGQLSGYWKFYYASGQINEEGNYQNNIKSGTWKYYYPNGQISSQGDYSNGTKSSGWTYYNSDGTVQN
jgi:antitoxin component YwqK of YwqJK toxin-antitoxin module